jgi:hypothetical protein
MRKRRVTYDEFQELKNDVANLSNDVRSIKVELHDLKQSIKDLKWFMLLPVVLLLVDRLMNHLW